MSVDQERFVVLPARLAETTIRRIAGAIANRSGPYAMDTARRRAALAYSVIKADAMPDGVYSVQDGIATKINFRDEP